MQKVACPGPPGHRNQLPVTGRGAEDRVSVGKDERWAAGAQVPGRPVKSLALIRVCREPSRAGLGRIPIRLVALSSGRPKPTLSEATWRSLGTLKPRAPGHMPREACGDRGWQHSGGKGKAAAPSPSRADTQENCLICCQRQSSRAMFLP